VLTFWYESRRFSPHLRGGCTQEEPIVPSRLRACRPRAGYGLELEEGVEATSLGRGREQLLDTAGWSMKGCLVENMN